MTPGGYGTLGWHEKETIQFISDVNLPQGVKQTKKSAIEFLRYLGRTLLCRFEPFALTDSGGGGGVAQCTVLNGHTTDHGPETFLQVLQHQRRGSHTSVSKARKFKVILVVTKRTS